MSSQASQGNTEHISRLISLLSAAALAVACIFYAGVAFEQRKFWPYEPLLRAFSAVSAAIEYRGFAPENAVADLPAGASREFFTVHNQQKLLPGYRALAGYSRQADGFVIWIFNTQGDVIHQRRLNYEAIDPDGASGGSEAPHSFYFLRDGSVVVNSDKGDFMVRYDVCGDAIWAKEGSYHHSLEADADGFLWTWKGEISAFSQYQYLVQFDPQTGETKREIGLAENIFAASEENKALFGIVPGHELIHEKTYRSLPDLFHPNDLDILSADMAANFSEFKPGDMLLSFRNINLVAVMDPDSLNIKWSSHGPWLQQHDPDFTRAGEISVYNNNRWRSKSSIIAMDPTTRKVRTIDIDPAFRFYSSYMGKHRYLDNGVLQVAVPHEGRALEFDSDGKLVLEINNLFSQKHNAFIADYNWLADDFFDTAPEQFVCDA
jgi:hypothetical protein